MYLSLGLPGILSHLNWLIENKVDHLNYIKQILK